jgi:PAS domain S-box-containing protein
VSSANNGLKCSFDGTVVKAHQDSPKIWSQIAEALAVMVLYFVAGRIGLSIPYTNSNVSPIWPAAGVALGGILLFGRHVMWGVAAGAFLVNFFSPIPGLAALGIAVGNALGPAVGASLLSRRSFTAIRRLIDVPRLIFFGSLGAAISALVGPAVLYLTGAHPPRLAWLTWWLGDTMGVLLVVPLLVNFADFKSFRPRLGELAALLLLIVGASGVMFHQKSLSEDVFAFGLLPLIIWGAVRFSVAGAALATMVLAAVAVWETGQGTGPFVNYASALSNAGVLQMFIAVLSLSGLCLAALISERASAEQALAQEEKLLRAEQRYRKMIETTNDGVWRLDGNFHTSFANRQMETMLGYSTGEMTGRHLTEFYFAEDVPRKREDMERRRAGLGEVIYNRLRHKDGSEVWALVSTTPVFSDNGKFDGVLAMLSDVTVLRKTEETLRRNEKLITAGRLAASISHEINNPLEAVINLLFLLKAQPMNDESREYVALAEKQIHRVSAICRRTLGFFRDTSAWTEFALADLIDDTLALYDHELALHRIEIRREYSTRGLVRASRGEIQQVFANIISNAIEAMGDSGVLIVRVTDTIAASAAGVRAEIEDTGSGISQADLGRIFEPFFTTKVNTGTGLGLWVAKEIVEKHGGTISARSHLPAETSSGTQFSIVLPSAKAAHAVAS